MRKFFIACMMLLSYATQAQHILRLLVKDDETRLPLIGATAYIDILKRGGAADTSGQIKINDIPAGKYEVKLSCIGYLSADRTFTVPSKLIDGAIEIFLEPMAGELAEVVIQTNRTGQNRSESPTRIEALPAEELDEKATMRPGDIKRLLGEVAGVQVRATSAVSGLAGFRMQGLESRYTQLLQDGFPVYDGFSGGLGLVQVSPLNLNQVEVIKGSASTLYGGGAIAGLINLITKTPGQRPEFNLLINQNSAKGSDASGFYSRRWNRVGVTLFSAYNLNGAYDPGSTGFSAIPKTNRFLFNPKIFWKLGSKDSLWMGVNLLNENRIGGDMKVIAGVADDQHQYFERNISDRLSSQISYTHKFSVTGQWNFKNAISYFKRSITQPQLLFQGVQVSSYTEVNFSQNTKAGDFVAGANVWTDHLTPKKGSVNLSYARDAYGIFVQHTLKPAAWIALESGLRLDGNTPSPAKSANGWFLVPRVNALFKVDEHWSSRIGGGLGYKMPDIFNEEAEERGYRNLQALNLDAIKAERSVGTNWDVTYKGAVGDAFLQINQLLFLTKVNDPLILQQNAFLNAPGYLVSKGSETTVKCLMDELGIYLGYTYTNVQRNFDGISSLHTLTPKHQFNADVTYEVARSFRIGAEGFYTGEQLLFNGATGRSFWTFSLLAQKMWPHLDIFINAENLTDQRQSRWGKLFIGQVSSPVFTEIYAPLDGLVVNAGVRFKVL